MNHHPIVTDILEPEMPNTLHQHITNSPYIALSIYSIFTAKFTVKNICYSTGGGTQLLYFGTTHILLSPLKPACSN
jgi:hypothetical protein